MLRMEGLSSRTNNPVRKALGKFFGKCDGCDSGSPPYDWTLEVLGTDGSKAEFPAELQDFGHSPGASIVPFSPADWDSSDCTLENCLFGRYIELSNRGYDYPRWKGYVAGPNSNTFAQELLRSCGITAIYWPDGITGVDR